MNIITRDYESRRFFHSVAEQLGEKLIDRGFEIENTHFGIFNEIKTYYRENYNEQVFYEWKRLWKWKKESVILSYTEKISESKIWPNVHVSVQFPNLSREVFVDGMNVSYLIKNKQGYKIPNYFLNLSKSKLSKEIINDVILALDWFNKYDTAQKCIERLQESKKMTGNKEIQLKLEETINFLEDYINQAQ